MGPGHGDRHENEFRNVNHKYRRDLGTKCLQTRKSCHKKMTCQIVKLENFRAEMWTWKPILQQTSTKYSASRIYVLRKPFSHYSWNMRAIGTYILCYTYIIVKLKLKYASRGERLAIWNVEVGYDRN